MVDSKSIEELIFYSRTLYERRLLHAAGGNTSVRDGEFVWISQTGAKLGSLCRDEIVKVNLQGEVLEGTAPSMEMGMHLAMYRARKDVGAVIHAHPTYAIALSTLLDQGSNDAIPPYTADFYVRAGRVPMIPYHHSGGHLLHEAVTALAASYHAILLRQHGLLVAGANMSDTFGIVEVIEQCCQICIAVGTKGACLTDKQCRDIDAALKRTWQKD